jgi:hypothetical protein
MNVLDNYREELLNLGDLQPIDEDDDLHYSKFSYNNMPFVIKTNKICSFKPTQKNKDNYVNISITSTDYLMWFETLYKWCIKTAYDRNEDWFNDDVTMSDLEFSFINPLKTNIKDKCFDIQCITNQNRLHIVDTKDNVHSLESLGECNVIPTFHIKGINFNSTYFTLDIELNNLLVVLEDSDDESPENDPSNDEKDDRNEKIKNEKDTKKTNSPQRESNKRELNEIHSETSKNTEPINSIEPSYPFDNLDKELDEVSIPTNDLEEMSMDIESNGFYKIYELLDEKIKDSMIQNLQKIFNKKKIKLNVDLMDIFDEE